MFHHEEARRLRHLLRQVKRPHQPLRLLLPKVHLQEIKPLFQDVEDDGS